MPSPHRGLPFTHISQAGGVSLNPDPNLDLNLSLNRTKTFWIKIRMKIQIKKIWPFPLHIVVLQICG